MQERIEHVRAAAEKRFAPLHTCTSLQGRQGNGREATISAAQYPTVEDYVGQTPLVRLQRLNPNSSNVVLCKLEGNNPAGSVKDR